MKHTAFPFSPKLWLDNRSLRTCSPAARAFWIDVLSLCYPSGYLVLENGKPMSDDQIAALVGAPVRLVRGWLKELGEAKIFSVSDDGRLYSSRMVKQAEFRAQAKVAGARGQERKKAVKEKLAYPQAQAALNREAPALLNAVAESVVAPPTPTQAVAPTAPVKKPLDWWLYPAGWIRQGALQAMSKRVDEAVEDFQIRVAARIPPGRHLDVLTSGQRAAVVEMTPKDPNAKKDKTE
jgi:hypothetical protein